MGIADRKERERLQVHESIVACAKRLFLEQGVENTSLQQIADAAEISKAAIYLHFRDKRDLLEEILVASFATLGEIHRRTFDPTASGLEQLKTWGGSYIELYREHPDEFYFTRLVEVLGIRYSSNNSEATAFELLLFSMKDDLLTCFRRGVADGSLRPDLHCEKTAVLVAQLVTDFMQSLAQVRSTVQANTGFSPEELIEHLFGLLARSIERQSSQEGRV
jgi:TetR/AcrR family transcriptional regulator